MSEKVDFKKALKELYNPKISGFHFIDVPLMNFLMVDGVGNPNNSTDYQQAVETLYSLAYTIKFAYKAEGLDHIVPPLEGLWWMEDMNEFTEANKHRWKWTMMIMQPKWVSPEKVEECREIAIKKQKISATVNIRFNPYHEGLSIQCVYFGTYSDEGPTIASMHQFINANGYQTNGKHHEIYLGDPRKAKPEKLQTIIRQPIRKI